MTPNLDGASCVGDWRLFDSTDQRDHDLARMICAECPVIDACRQILEAQHTNEHHRPVGTWAGILVGVTGARRRSVECGTEQGYQRHRHTGDECEPCLVAHRLHERDKARERRAKAKECAA